MVDLGEVIPLRRILLFPAGRGRFHAWVTGSRDGSKWRPLAEVGRKGRRAVRGPLLAFFPPEPCRFVKINLLSGAGAGLAEVRLFHTPGAWRRPGRVQGDKGSNLALGRPVLSSPWEDGWPPERAVDGRTSYEDGYWAGAAPPPQWLVVDLGKPRVVSQARIFFYAGDSRAYAFFLESSPDGRRWRTLADFSRDPQPAVKRGLQVVFGPHRTRYLKITVTKNTANTSAHIAELQVFPG